MHSISFQTLDNFFGSSYLQLQLTKTFGTEDFNQTGAYSNLLGTIMSMLSALKFILMELVNITTFIHIKDSISTSGTQYGSKF